MNPNTFPLRIVIACLALGLAGGAMAETADKGKPITFSADGAEVNYETGSGILKGNVIITQGTITIRANRIEFKQNPDNSLSATAFGNPLAFRQKRDGMDAYDEGWAQRAVYDGAKEHLELFDNAILKRGTDEIRSNYITYNSKTELFKAEGRPSTTPIAGEAGRNDRVRGTFQPKETPQPGKAPSPKSNPPLSLSPSGELAPSKAK
jgi:lipopolysaccharide export system protein LptA